MYYTMHDDSQDVIKTTKAVKKVQIPWIEERGRGQGGRNC